MIGAHPGIAGFKKLYGIGCALRNGRCAQGTVRSRPRVLVGLSGGILRSTVSKQLQARTGFKPRWFPIAPIRKSNSPNVHQPAGFGAERREGS